MPLRLGGVDLNENMVWVDRFSSNSVAQTVKRTLGGNTVVFSASLNRGSPVTLLSTAEFGWLEKSTVDQLLSMAAVPGAVYTLEVGAEQLSVVFRHDEPPAVQMEPLVPRLTHSSSDYFIGQIKLLYV